MRFEVKNISTFRTYSVPDDFESGACQDIKPGQTAYVSDSAKDLLVTMYNTGSEVIDWIQPATPNAQADLNIKIGMKIPVYGNPIQVIGTAPDLAAPGALTVNAANTTWAAAPGAGLVDLGRYANTITITNTGSANIEVSFSGFSAPATAPDANRIIQVAGGKSFTWTSSDGNMERYFLYRTTGVASTFTIAF